MRLALFHPKFTEVGGAEILALKQADLLRQGGVEVEFVTFSVKGGFWTDAFQGWTVRIVPKRTWRDLAGGWTRMGKLRQRGRRALPFLEGYDAVLATNHPASTMLARMPIKGAKVWYCNETPRSLFPRETAPYAAAALDRLGPVTPGLVAIQQELRAVARPFNPYQAARAANLDAMPRIPHRLFNSRFSLANAQAAYGPMAGEVLYPVIDFPPPGAPRKGLDRDAPRILVQARLTPLKNLETVLGGFKAFQGAHPKAELHILGSGPSKAALQAQAGDGVQFHGFLSREEVARLRERCSVFALLSLDEPFGMVYPEAAAQGLLLVGPDHGGPVEILRDGELGWVCPALEPAAFQGALEAILATSDADLDRRREEADRSCRERFSPEVLGPQLLAFTRGAAESQPR